MTAGASFDPLFSAGSTCAMTIRHQLRAVRDACEDEDARACLSLLLADRLKPAATPPHIDSRTVSLTLVSADAPTIHRMVILPGMYYTTPVKGLSVKVDGF